MASASSTVVYRAVEIPADIEAKEVDRESIRITDHPSFLDAERSLEERGFSKIPGDDAYMRTTGAFIVPIRLTSAEEGL